MAIYIVKSWYKKGDNEPIWVPKVWYGEMSFNPDGSSIWNDGEVAYLSAGTAQYVLNSSTSTWSSKTWYGDFPSNTGFNASNVWNDGTDIYCSKYDESSQRQPIRIQKKLDKESSTWNNISSWSKPISGQDIWKLGTNVYCSYPHYNYYGNYIDSQYIYNRALNIWDMISWTIIGGGDPVSGRYIWSDGVDTYCSRGYTALSD